MKRQKVPPIRNALVTDDSDCIKKPSFYSALIYTTEYQKRFKVY